MDYFSIFVTKNNKMKVKKCTDYGLKKYIVFAIKTLLDLYKSKFIN